MYLYIYKAGYERAMSRKYVTNDLKSTSNSTYTE